MDLIKWNNIFVLMKSKGKKVSKTEIAELNSKKDQIVEELFNWAQTFDNEVDENGEYSSKSYDVITSLAERFDKGLCDNDDYINVLFHIWQINYDEECISFEIA